MTENPLNNRRKYFTDCWRLQLWMHGLCLQRRDRPFLMFHAAVADKLTDHGRKRTPINRKNPQFSLQRDLQQWWPILGHEMGHHPSLSLSAWIGLFTWPYLPVAASSVQYLTPLLTTSWPWKRSPSKPVPYWWGVHSLLAPHISLLLLIVWLRLSSSYWPTWLHSSHTPYLHLCPLSQCHSLQPENVGSIVLQNVVSYNIYHITSWCHNPEDHDLNSCRR